MGISKWTELSVEKYLGRRMCEEHVETNRGECVRSIVWGEGRGRKREVCMAANVCYYIIWISLRGEVFEEKCVWRSVRRKDCG